MPPLIRDQYGRRKVLGTGPFPSPYMAVAEAPGQTEDKTGIPLFGKSGKEFDRYLQQAGLRRRYFYLTNIVKYRPFTSKVTGNSAPTVADIARDEPELFEEIEKVRPKWIAAVGRVSARWFFNADIDLDDVRGFAWPVTICFDCKTRQPAEGSELTALLVGLKLSGGDLNDGRTCSCGSSNSITVLVVPVTHPAAGLHQSEQQPQIHYDFLRLGKLIRGEIQPIPPIDEFPEPEYGEIYAGSSTNPSGREIVVSNSQDRNVLVVHRKTKEERVLPSRDRTSGKCASAPAVVRSGKGRNPGRSNHRSLVLREELRQPGTLRGSNGGREQTQSRSQNLDVLARTSQDGRELVLVQDQRSSGENATLQVVQSYLAGNLSKQEQIEIAVDTEGYKDSPWCLTLSTAPGSAVMVKQDSAHIVKQFLEKNIVVLHNAPYDLRVLAAMGIDVDDFHDSMQAAYVLRLLPKGLKALGRRYKGVSMESYRSVVAPADREIMLQYLNGVLRYRCVDCAGAGEVIKQPISAKTGKLLAERPVKCETCAGDGTAWEPPPERLEVIARKVAGKLTGKDVKIASGRRMGWRVRNILKDAGKVDPETGQLVDLRKRWEGMRKDNYEFAIQVEDRLGPARPVALGDVPYGVALNYACRDADVTRRIWPDLEAEVRSEGLWPVYEMDRNVIPMITRMMDVGWRVDVPYLNKLSNQLEIQQDRILYRLEELVGHPINPNSSKQVAEVLFDELGLHPVRVTDSGMDSTDNKVLADLRIHANTKASEGSKQHKLAYDVISGFLDYRERGKIRSTYTLSLPRLVDEHSRLHTTLSNTATESGRLASRDPNLQNISQRTENGKLVRGAFTCGDGNVLLECDYSQVEFRLIAHEANDKTLIRAIRNGVDPHNLTTSKVFGIPIEKITKSMWQRDAGKTVSFAVLYGASAPTIKMQVKLASAKHTPGGVDVPIEQVQDWIDDYTQRIFPAIGEFMQDAQAEARRYGYVQDMWGRRRYLPGVHSPINSVRSEAERIATNHKIQAGAQGIIKIAMAQIWQEVLPKFRKRGYCEAIMQVHDSVVFEVKKELVGELKKAVLKVMTGVVKLKVPIDVDGKVGVRWNELKAA